MAGLFTAIGAVGEVLHAFDAATSNPKDAVKEVSKARNKIGAYTSDGSVTKFLSNFIVEPVIIITKEARSVNIADKLMLLNTNIFSSFYAQAFYALADLYEYEPMVAIDVLGTDNKSMLEAVATTAAPYAIEFAVESSKPKDYFAELINSNSKYLHFSTEAIAGDGKSNFEAALRLKGIDPDEFWEYYGRADDDQREYLKSLVYSLLEGAENDPRNKNKDIFNNTELNKALKKAKKQGNGKGIPEDKFEALVNKLAKDNNYKQWKKDKNPKPKQEVEKGDELIDKNLSYVSRKVDDLQAENLYFINHRDLRLSLTIRRGNGETRTIIVPITIKTHIIATTIDHVLNMLKPNDKTKKLGYRFDEWRAGSISLRELIFCGDLIKSYKKNKLKDKDGLLSIVKKREESANAKLLTSDMIGFEKFYNMVIVTADEKVLLNKHIGGDILNEKYKQELLTEAHALTLSVVDQDYERVYILTKDIRGKSDVTFKSISKSNDKNADLESIMKALMANRPPVF